jgi:plastocyanin
MPRFSRVLVVVAAALALAAAGAALAFATTDAQGSAQALQGKLAGKVGPGFTIALTQKGKAVKTLKAGTYKISVNDKSNSHNFHLFGPGVNKKTGVGFTGNVTWTVKLKKGKYTYRCDVHFTSGMIGRFTVGLKTSTVTSTTTTTTGTTGPTTTGY